MGLTELTPSVASFRSPVHKKMFERRSHYYAQYKAAFACEVKRFDSELAGREEKETAGQRNWLSMIAQLKGETESVDEPVEQETAPEQAAAPPLASPKGKRS